jgi:N-acetylmuramoyl-L-alanine amidase
MAANALLKRLVTVYKGDNIRYPQLRPITLAQWMLESGRCTSKLAKEYYNFGGIKWRPEMAAYATKIKYEANDGVDYYCKFATIENFINGYWAFLNRAPYTGWEEHVSSGEEFIRFISPTYTPSPKYADRVINLLPEAEQLLAEDAPVAMALAAGQVNLGTIVLDPGHGGTKNIAGSAANHAISKSGVKEKKLTLDFCLILRDELLKQAQKANENIKVTMTRTADVNLSLAARAGLAFSEKAKLFLCLHFNGDKNSAIRGAETYFRAKANGNLNLEKCIAFATDVQKALFGGFKSVDPTAKNRGVKPDTESGPKALGVLNDKALGNDRRTDMCRAAYVEAEFITNPTVDTLFISGSDAIANRTAVMASVAKAIRAHMKGMA